MKKLLWLASLIVVAAIIAGGYFGLKTLVQQKKDGEKVSETISEQIATSSAEQVDQNNNRFSYIPTATTTTPTAWKSFDYPGVDPATNGYSIAYPANLVVSQNGSSLVLAFPKDIYFHWPLQDETRITITASSTCTTVNPDLEQGPNFATTTFSLNGYPFDVKEINDAAAGNLYRDLIYETESNNVCYVFDLFDHAANGAGLYVDDQALIRRYDDQHTTDIGLVIGIFNSIVNSFRMR